MEKNSLYKSNKAKQEHEVKVTFFFGWILGMMPELTSHKSMALSRIQLGKLLSFGTLALHSGHCSALFGFAINPEIPTENISPSARTLYNAG